MTPKKAGRLFTLLLLLGYGLILAGKTWDVYLLTAIGALTVAAGFFCFFLFYRCPYCMKHLGRGGGGTFCPYCGKEFPK